MNRIVREPVPDIKKLSEVFKTVGLPPYTYVKPKHFGEVRADVEQPGKHLLIQGPSGIGKTCVVFKVFEELGWQRDWEYMYVPLPIIVWRVLAKLKSPFFEGLAVCVLLLQQSAYRIIRWSSVGITIQLRMQRRGVEAVLATKPEFLFSPQR